MRHPNGTIIKLTENYPWGLNPGTKGQLGQIVGQGEAFGPYSRNDPRCFYDVRLQSSPYGRNETSLIPHAIIEVVSTPNRH